MLSIIIPTLNEAIAIEQTLRSLEAPDLNIQMIVSDGGSTDDTCEIAKRFGARVLNAPQGRGAQLVAGANAASHPWLLFLHADTQMDKEWQKTIKDFIKHRDSMERAAVFKFVLADPNPAARRLEQIVDWRCRLFGLPYGDQGLLISRQLYDQIGGFKAMPLFEDVDIIRRIGRRNIEYLNSSAVTSAIRYQKNGYIFRSFKNVACLSLYFTGLPPKLIGRLYQ